MEKMKSFGGKVVHPRFQNGFTDTSGFEEYGKYLAGDNLNPDRIFVTPEGIYQLGNAKAEGFVGYGGTEFYLWKSDGNIVQVRDIWRLQDRTDEKITVFKKENVFKFHSKENFLALSEESFEGLHIIIADYALGEIIYDTNEKYVCKTLSCDLVEERLFKVLSKTEDELRCAVIYSYIKEMKESGKNECRFTWDNDQFKSDCAILSACLKNEQDIGLWNQLFLETRWQESFTGFKKELQELKEVWYGFLCKKNDFDDFVMVRTKLNFLIKKALIARY